MLRDVNIGKPVAETIPVSVLSNTDVVRSLSNIVNELTNVIEELRKTQTALAIILGQDIDLEEGN